MSNYTYQQGLLQIWERAVAGHRAGQRDLAKLFEEADLAFIDSIGATPREVSDFAEDFVTSGEPDFTTFAQLADMRRSYFLIRQGGKRSGREVQNHELPPKQAAVRGIEWLPRIIVKARAKLRGEMNDDLMYGCGGDRNFLRQHDLHPAEFLRLVEYHGDNDEAIIDYVAARR